LLCRAGDTAGSVRSGAGAAPASAPVARIPYLCSTARPAPVDRDGRFAAGTTSRSSAGRPGIQTGVVDAQGDKQARHRHAAARPAGSPMQHEAFGHSEHSHPPRRNLHQGHPANGRRADHRRSTGALMPHSLVTRPPRPVGTPLAAGRSPELSTPGIEL
jgi:hypothetical protein